VSSYAVNPLIFSLFSGNSDKIMFLPLSPIETGNHLDRAEEITNIAKTTGTVDFFDLLAGIM
jgi:hypothetical protein